jgi:REP element-mobilizing transposase RayT
MGYIKIWVHVVWTTKNREPLLQPEIRYKIFEHIREQARKKEIQLDFINGYSEHVHGLISLGSGFSIDKVVQLLKGESSCWINKAKMLDQQFEWQEEYFAVSVSESLVGRVRNYIRNQEEHHRKCSFQEEYDEFLVKQGFKSSISG